MKAIVFDIDGTLANIEHRRHFVQSKPKNWKAFNKGMKDDKPNHDIIWLMSTLWLAGNTILIASGRGEEDRLVTATWLAEQQICPSTDDFIRMACKGTEFNALYDKLYMRKAGDYRADNIVKSEILDQMYLDGYEPDMVFDDRDQVVKMWRERGVRCLQVADGDF